MAGVAMCVRCRRIAVRMSGSRPLRATIRLAVPLVLAGCAGADIRYERPIALNGRIDDIAQCTITKLTDAGFGPPRLSYMNVPSQPRSYLIYRNTSSAVETLGLQLLRIDFEQLSQTRAQARVSPALIGGARPAQVAVAALTECGQA
jgi:hypothetical protein